MGLPTWSAQITRSDAVPNDEANDQAVVHIECLFVSRGLCRLVVDLPEVLRAMLETCGSAGEGCTFPVTESSLKQ